MLAYRWVNREARIKIRRVISCLVVMLLVAACSGKEQATLEPTFTPATAPTSSLQLRTFEALWSAVNENYVYDDFQGIDWQAVRDEYLPQVRRGLGDDEFAETMQAMLAELPPGVAAWQTREERIEWDTQDRTNYEGIGAYVTFRNLPEPRVVLRSVMPGSPAEQAGLKAHDSILAIDGLPVRADEGLEAVERIRGPAGSQVTLSVRSPGESPREITVARGSITAADRLRLGFAVPDSAIGYLLFPPAAYEKLPDEVVASLQLLAEERQLEGVILDLRIVSGSMRDWPLETLLTLLTVFGNGDLGEFFTRTKTQPLTVEGQDYYDSQKLPLAILVGPDTSGRAEILAAALQASGRAAVVGLSTLGNVEGGTEFPLPDGSRVFVTSSSYRTSDGRDIGLTGVEPDVRVEADWDAVTSKDDPVRDAAVEALRSSGD